jgi:starch synthase (maltosyl-transferring)
MRIQKTGRKRVVIENLKPSIDCGKYPIKRVVGESVTVEANVFGDGHDVVNALVVYRRKSEKKWSSVPMDSLGNDVWRGTFRIETEEEYEYSVEGWIDPYKTWIGDIKKKHDAGQDVGIDLIAGALMAEEALKKAKGLDRSKLKKYAAGLRDHSNIEESYEFAIDAEFVSLMDVYPAKDFAARADTTYTVWVDRKKAMFSAWYECFPRSCSPVPGKHGTFRDLIEHLPAISSLGFDILYLPPIHPIGKSFRKGRNNSLESGPDDPGSPWAIGSDEGGHTEIHPHLGTLEDFSALVNKAKSYDLEIALDLAFQCTPDHPYVKEHPEWFRKRPDGTIQYAENPPKKYQDIYPLNFETDQWESLWKELRRVVFYWIENGVRIFRVDNPHTKPFAFWEWLIGEIRSQYPDVILLSEAFTRPKVMYRLAKVGFTQSYTYFTWRNTKQEFIDYLTELTATDVREYFRPNFWPNTPDILPQHLQFDGRQEFIKRLILAATLSANYGIYGPVFELCIREAIEGKEEYLNSEKYEIKVWDRDQPGNIKDIITRVNKIRRANPALQYTNNIQFLAADNDFLLCYDKMTVDGSNTVLIIVNMDPHHTQSGFVKVPLSKYGLSNDKPFHVHDLLTDEKYIWQGEANYVELNPHKSPAHILKIYGPLMKESDFDYFA